MRTKHTYERQQDINDTFSQASTQNAILTFDVSRNSSVLCVL